MIIIEIYLALPVYYFLKSFSKKRDELWDFPSQQSLCFKVKWKLPEDNLSFCLAFVFENKKKIFLIKQFWQKRNTVSNFAVREKIRNKEND